jgi:transcriptional regulator with XRE-family HTH domain
MKYEFGNVIRELREERGIKQKWVAEKVGITVNRMGRLERGESEPTVDELARIANIYGITLQGIVDKAMRKVVAA